MLTGFLYFLSIILIVAAFIIAFFTLRSRRGFFFGVFSTSAALLLSSVASIYRANLISGTSVISVYIDEVFAVMNRMLADMPEQQLSQFFGFIQNGDAEAIKNSLISYSSSLKELYTLLFPSVIILNTLLMSYFIYMLAKQFMGLMKKDVSMLPKFSELKLKRSAAFMLAASYVLPMLIKSELFAAAFSNIGVILGGIAFVCGLSALDFSLRRRIRSAWLRFFAYLAAFFILSQGIGLAVIVFVFVAVLDSFFNFRRLHVQEVMNDGQ